MSELPERLDLRSIDIAEEKREALLELLPEVRTEDGKIDFDRLRLALGEAVDVGRERYGMTWPGKAECFKTIQAPSLATLRPCPEESVNFDTTENLIIEGDNLEVLKLLQKSYLGKVKMIYIDPPYNTGNDFIYPDSYSESLQTYLEYTGQVDSLGRKFGTNADTNGRFHSKWLNMMYPRLYLARNLLREDGVIFVSIDDTELSNLQALCNEIFGEENFLGTIARGTGQTTGQDSGGLGSSFDFVLSYAKRGDFDLSGVGLTQKDLLRFENEDERGKYSYDQMRKTGSADRREDRPNMFYAVQDPDGGEVWPIAPAGYEGRWRFERKTYERLVAEKLILWRKTKRGEELVWWPYVKYYLEGRTKRPSPLWTDLDGNKKAARDLRELFDGKKVFDFPKPVAMLRRCIEIAPNSSRDDIVLDFFAGSGSLGEAVLRMNQEDGGARRFILIQLPEKCAPDSDAAAAGFATIAEITKERLRRVLRRLEEERTGQLTEESAADLGFRVFKLAESNFTEWTGADAKDSESLAKQLDMHVDHTRDGRSQTDMLAELLLKSGFPLTAEVELLSIEGKSVYSVAGGALLVCIEQELNLDLIRAMAKLQPERVLCLDEGFAGNDQLKTNAVLTFRDAGVTAFKTV